MSTARNTNVVSDDGGNKRRAKSLPPSRRGSDNAHAAIAGPTGKKRRVSARNFKHCQDIDALPLNLRCSGCVRWDESSKKKPRDETKTREMQCCQAWKRTSVPPAKEKHFLAIKAHIEETLRIDMESFQESILNESETTNPPPATTTTITVDDAPGPANPPKPRRKIKWLPHKFRCEGEETCIMVPSTHQIERGSDVSRWQNGYDKLQAIKQKLQRNQFQTTSLFAQSSFATAAGSVPALALSAAQFLFPLIVMAMFHDTGLFDDDDFSIDKHVKSFPSDAALRKCNLHQAVRDTVYMSCELRPKKIGTACDKGNKKGVGHFAKVMTEWDPNRCVVGLNVLDIDAAGGASVECAQSIRASVNKLKTNDNHPTHLLSAQGTDAGGGGVLDSLHVELQALQNVCVAPEDCLVANCCIHGLQLQLRNAVVHALGDGGLEKVNAVQLIHTVCDLQESLDMSEWRHMLFEASKCTAAFDPATAGAMMPTSKSQENEMECQQALATVFGFHSKFNVAEAVDPTSTSKHVGAIHAKMTAPILTRWWTVGAGSSYTFEHCLRLFHAAQIVVNTYKSSSGPHGVASCLFAHMSNTENFIDLTLIRGYHKGYTAPHLDWMQSCQDLTATLGFQAHNIAMRFFLMDCNLQHLPAMDVFNDYTEAMDKAGLVRGTDKCKRNLKKLAVFVTQSKETLHKHFGRWLSPKLLPAALLSETPLAKLIAAIVLKMDRPPNEALLGEGVVGAMRMSGTMFFKSTAHDQMIDLLRFDKFARSIVKDDAVHKPQAVHAAQLVCNGIDLRSFDCVGQVGAVRLDMHSTCLLLPS